MSIEVPITVWSEVLQSHQVCTGILQSSHVHTRPHWTSCLVQRYLIIPTLNRIEYNDVAQRKLCYVISNVTTLKFLAPRSFMNLEN